MKKLLSTIAMASIITSISVYAEEMPWEFICEPSELSWISDKRYFYVSGSNTFPAIYADSKRIQINRKNKTIKSWIINLASEEGRQNAIKALGQYRDYSNFGYIKTLEIYDYSNMRSTTKSTSHFSCDGAVIRSSEDDMEPWSNIIPGSVQEGIVESLIKKYNLK